MQPSTSALAVLGLLACASAVSSTVYFSESFDAPELSSQWVYSKTNHGAGMFALSSGKFHADPELNRGLKTTQDARFYQIAAAFDKSFNNKDKTLVVQFTVKHEQNIDCGGAYVKILAPDVDLKEFNGDTPYNVMFGPDVCGQKKVHMILNGGEENIENTEGGLSPFADQLTHIYTLVLRPDQTYTVLLDQEEQINGTLGDWKGLIKPKVIPDPEAKKPEDWVDEEEMDDPEDVRPEDYVEIPATIPNPESVKPADWDSEDDGKWAPASLPNPDYTGEGWSPKRIPNPAYEGEWEVPTIANPEYVEGRALNYTHGAIGIDIWQVLSGTIFDNFLVTDDEEFAKAEAKRVWGDLKEKEKEAFEAFSSKDAEKVSKLAKDASLAGDDEPVQDIRTGKEKDIAEDDLLDEIDEEAEEAAKVKEVKEKIEEVIEEVEDEVKEKEKEKDTDKAAEEEVKVVEEEVEVVEEKAEEVKEEIKEKAKVTKENVKKVAEEITKAAEKVKAAKKKITEEKVIETTHDEL